MQLSALSARDNGRLLLELEIAKSGRQDLNLRSPPPRDGALPIELRPVFKEQKVCVRENFICADKHFFLARAVLHLR